MGLWAFSWSSLPTACPTVLTRLAEILNSDAGTQARYLLMDHLGSPDVILGQDLTILEQLSFDPWGKRRQDDWSPAQQAISSSTPTGFTGHEMDDETGMINMAARLYDPLLGRFLSADTIIPQPKNLQGFNRYSYVVNNPLRYVDPTGHHLSSSDHHDDEGEGMGPEESLGYDGHEHSEDLSGFGDEEHEEDDYVADTNISAPSHQPEIPAVPCHEVQRAKPPTQAPVRNWSIVFDATHDLLTIAGLTPLAGVVTDLLDVALYGFQGDVKGMTMAGFAAVPGGQLARGMQYGAKALGGTFSKIGRGNLNHAEDFDTARRQAFENAGMTNPDKVKFSKVDPETGTVVEFKGEKGAKVAYDAPHVDMNPSKGHDKPHVGWQSGGKQPTGGNRGNNTYDGPQHPSRPTKK